VTYVPYVAIVLAFLQIHVPRQVAGGEMKKLAGGYDNHDPRGQQSQLAGRGKRALAAHQNGLEAFAPFAVAVLACVQRAVRPELVGWLAIGFIAVRTVYIAAYIADRPSLRSAMWAVGMLVTVALMGAAVAGA
jgi:uncharacterized MAPEG superfamily protein